MRRSIRLTIAFLLTSVLVLTALGVWAAPKFQGTVPPVPTTVQGTCSGGPIDMGTAVFTPQSGNCTLTVELVEDPAATYAPAPQGKSFVGNAFKVTAQPPDTIVQACYAYPPEFENKGATIYRLNEASTPALWVEVGGANVGEGVICVTSGVGVFALIGSA